MSTVQMCYPGLKAGFCDFPTEMSVTPPTADIRVGFPGGATPRILNRNSEPIIDRLKFFTGKIPCSLLQGIFNYSQQGCIFLNGCSVNLIDDYFLNTDKKESLMVEIEKTL